MMMGVLVSREIIADLISCFLAVSDVGDGGWWRLLEVEVMATVGSGVGDGDGW
ncbi:hypothetical protein Hanom_Chr02g00139641 [Helianthus anomalus]